MKRKFKYFFCPDDFNVYRVSPKYHVQIDIINDRTRTDEEVNAAYEIITQNCPVHIKIDATTQYL